MGKILKCSCVLAVSVWLAACSGVSHLEKKGGCGASCPPLKSENTLQTAPTKTAKNPSIKAYLCSAFGPCDSKTTCPTSAEGMVGGTKNPSVPKLKFPVPEGVMSSAFGYRRGIFHSGLDISAPKGDPVKACADGKVVFVGSRKGCRSYGQTVLLDHGGNVFTHYAHLSAIHVRPGQSVTSGRQIGLVGSTGRSTAPHLHLEVKVGRQFHNPLFYFPSGELKNIEVAKSFTDTPMGPVGVRRRPGRR